MTFRPGFLVLIENQFDEILRLEHYVREKLELDAQQWRNNVIDALYAGENQKAHQLRDEAQVSQEELEKSVGKQSRYAILVVAYGLFESTLERTCNRWAENNSSNLRVHDLSGRGIERSRTFVSKIVGKSHFFEGSDWEELKSLVEVRNVVAHANGRLAALRENKAHALKSKISKVDGLAVEKEELRIESVWLRQSILRMKKFSQMVAIELLTK